MKRLIILLMLLLSLCTSASAVDFHNVSDDMEFYVVYSRGSLFALFTFDEYRTDGSIDLWRPNRYFFNPDNSLYESDPFIFDWAWFSSSSDYVNFASNSLDLMNYYQSYYESQIINPDIVIPGTGAPIDPEPVPPTLAPIVALSSPLMMVEAMFATIPMGAIIIMMVSLVAFWRAWIFLLVQLRG